MKYILQYEPEISDVDISAVSEYMSSGGFITEFKKSREFEAKLADFTGLKHSILFPNGTLTLFAIIKCLDLPKGSKIIVPNYTMAATAFSVSVAGHLPIFCDVEFPSLCLCFDSFKQACEDNNIAAVMLMAANGRYPSYDIKEFVDFCSSNNIKVIEDSAQALSSYYPTGNHIGTASLASSISFSMPKIITCGQGGAVLTDSDLLADNLRSFRDFGRSGGGSDIHRSIGLNLKFTDLQSVLGLSQLSRIVDIARRKKDNFTFLKESIDSEYIKLLDNDLEFTTPWFYEVVTPYRDELIMSMQKKSIQTRPMYPELNKQEAYKDHHQFATVFDTSAMISKNGLWIPSHPKLSHNNLELIADTINKFSPH